MGTPTFAKSTYSWTVRHPRKMPSGGAYMKRLIARAVALLAAAVVLGSCGGGGNSTPDGGNNTPVGGKPTVPIVSGGTGVSSSQVLLNIIGGGGVGVDLAGYKIYRDGTFLVALETNTSTKFNDKGLAPSTRYCYRASAFNTNGIESDLSAEVCATTLSSGGSNACAPGTKCSDCLDGHYNVCGWCNSTGLCQTGTANGPTPTIGVCPSGWTFAPGGTPYNACGPGSPVCTDCIHSCQGVSGCCTGCGCLCEYECHAVGCY